MVLYEMITLSVPYGMSSSFKTGACNLFLLKRGILRNGDTQESVSGKQATDSGWAGTRQYPPHFFIRGMHSTGAFQENTFEQGEENVSRDDDLTTVEPGLNVCN